MTFITLALYYQPPGLTATWAGFWFNQSAALLGNIIGGGLLIGGSEYWMYHWRSWSEPSRHMGRWGRVQPVIPPPDSEEMEKGKLDDEGLAELDPGMAQFSRVPTLLSTSDPVLSYSGAGGKGRSVAPEAIRTDSMIYVSPGAYRRQTGLQGAVSFAGEPYLVPGTFSGMQSRPVVIVESPPVSAPVSPIVPVARRSSGQIKAL